MKRRSSGTGELTSKLLIYGTKKRNAFNRDFGFIGAGLSTGAANVASVSLTILKDLAVGLELLAEILTASTFPQDEIDRQKQAIIAVSEPRKIGAVAGRAFAAALFPQSPYGRPVEAAAQ
jgi:predicted Zn-dependent peptidase